MGFGRKFRSKRQGRISLSDIFKESVAEENLSWSQARVGKKKRAPKGSCQEGLWKGKLSGLYAGGCVI